MTKIGLTILLTLLVASAGWAENPVELKQDKLEIKHVQKSLNQLNRLIDKWHEANLADDGKKVRQCEHAIISLLVKDLNSTFRAIERAEKERARSGKGQDAKRRVDDEKDFAAVRTLLASKQMLLYKLKKADSFSVKYLALTNYQRLLSRELGMAKMEFVEDVREKHQDRR